MLAGVAVVGPAEGVAGELGAVADKGVLLLNSVPGFFGFHRRVLPDLVGKVAEVGVGWHELRAAGVGPAPALAEHEDVVALAEGVAEVGHGLEDDLRLVSDRLVGARAIIVPFGDVSEAGDGLTEGAALGAQGDAGAVEPNVLGDNSAALVEAVEPVGVLVVEIGVGPVRHLKGLVGFKDVNVNKVLFRIK